jgi:PleD family two-component response regulator
MFDDSAQVRAPDSNMRKSRKPHPIVEVVENAASELNDLLNAIGLRIALLRPELEAPGSEAEMVRLAGLVERATQCVQRLQAYTRAEELVALMRRGRGKKKTEISAIDSPPFLSDDRQRTALLMTHTSTDDSAIRDCLERSGCQVVEAKSAAEGLKLLQSDRDFDHIVCDSIFLAETGWKFTAELSRAAPHSRVYVLHRPRVTDRATQI